MAVVLSTAASFVVAGYAQEHLFAVSGAVIDQTGAVIPQAEVVFKGESGTVVAHTSANGSVDVNLKAGEYVVKVSAFAFATTELVDFSVPRATADAFRVVLMVDPRANLRSDRYVQDDVVPTIPIPELPNVIDDEPTHTSLSVAQASTSKHRSMRCFYLWRCSASQP
jgi:hypothetical protein